MWNKGFQGGGGEEHRKLTCALHSWPESHKLNITQFEFIITYLTAICSHWDTGLNGEKGKLPFSPLIMFKWLSLSQKGIERQSHS